MLQQLGGIQAQAAVKPDAASSTVTSRIQRILPGNATANSQSQSQSQGQSSQSQNQSQNQSQGQSQNQAARIVVPPLPKIELIHGWDTQQVQDLQQQTARALQSPVEFQHDLKSDGKGPAMLVIPAGIYKMGSDKYKNEKPIHQVTISKPFAMGKYPVTFEEYDAFCVATGRDKPNDRDW
ncbi:hypothetical protein TI05_19600, partial [Achromatium sp. WMS3]